jgi:pimeloyl-ACP methyl ester carboxylesterase
MPYIKIDSDTIHYTRSPAAAGGPVLLAVHGSGGDHRHWPEAFRNWPAVEAIAVDMPGHGRSAGKGCQQVADYADFIEAFVSGISPGQVVLIGHSLGGAIAQTLALRKPGWLAGCALVGTGARLKVAPVIRETLVNDYRAAAQILAEWSFSPQADPELVAVLKNGLHNTEAETVIDDFNACHRFDVMNDVHRIHIPTLVISGSADRLTPVKYGRYLADRIPGAIHRVIENAGHMLALENPTAFMAILEEFLRHAVKLSNR